MSILGQGMVLCPTFFAAIRACFVVDGEISVVSARQDGMSGRENEITEKTKTERTR